MIKAVLAIAALGVALPVVAQDLASQEVVVTGSRVEQDSYERDMPAVGLRRTADFLVQEVAIRGDTRDPKLRGTEIRQMLARAVEMAGKHGVQLAFGDYILTPLTVANLDEVTLSNDNRPDSQKVEFLVKAPLGGKESGASAEKRIEAYVDAVPEVGRAQMDISGDSSLSIVGPDQYRLQIAESVMADARSLSERMGAGYAVTIEGLNMPVLWTRAGPSDVLLYIPYKLVIVPKR
ncbi:MULTISPECIES: TonB-dependent receptor [unclassified Sphingomonas]|uniref:TonB-dependent receptor n=1 Tax=unclassified Sphingomonas TaxID=196159 RepID=UPI002150AE80|nr:MULTISPECIES: TonB-dependent receptor [unclassified Sphingomonas]MCR5872311.1 TonB-dependent receptor [Sphingomonas sp. J344]UUX99393.1 TonB-dependent receptor [Sphingomonas sp. J315]